MDGRKDKNYEKNRWMVGWTGKQIEGWLDGYKKMDGWI